MISLLVATDPRGVIGNKGKIPWYIPLDLQLFKNRTMGSSIIMGRVTYQSLPVRPLLGRVNYVVSHTKAPVCPHRSMAESLAGPIWCKSFDEAITDAKKNTKSDGTQKEIFVIGGEQIYKLALESGIVERIILSRIRKEYDGDRFFHVPDGWAETEKESHDDFDIIHFMKDSK